MFKKIFDWFRNKFTRSKVAPPEKKPYTPPEHREAPKGITHIFRRAKKLVKMGHCLECKRRFPFQTGTKQKCPHCEARSYTRVFVMRG